MSAHPEPAHGGHAAHPEPDPIKEFYDRNKKLEAWINTHDVTHSHVYTTAAKELLAENGVLKLEKLKDAQVQEKFIDKMVDLYLKNAKELHGVEVPQGDDADFSKRDLLYMMSGHTRETLEQAVKGMQDGYTLGTHKEITKKHIKDLTERHGSYVAAALQPKHKEKLLKFMGLEEKADEYDWPTANNLFQKYIGSEIGQERFKTLYEKNPSEHH